MTAEDRSLESRLDDLEQRVGALERAIVSREVLDEEIRSLERRLREVRELTEG